MAPATFSADAMTRTLTVFALVVAKNEDRPRKIDEHRRGDDQRLMRFAFHAIDFPEARLDAVDDLLTADLERELHRERRRILGPADQRLIGDGKGARRAAFAEPIRLRKRQRRPVI